MLRFALCRVYEVGLMDVCTLPVVNFRSHFARSEAMPSVLRKIELLLGDSSKLGFHVVSLHPEVYTRSVWRTFCIRGHSSVLSTPSQS